MIILYFNRSQARTDLLMCKYMEGDDKNVLKLLKREGRKDKRLCVQVLHYFVRACTEIKKNGTDGKEVEKGGAEDSDEGSDSDANEQDDERYEHSTLLSQQKFLSTIII